MSMLPSLPSRVRWTVLQASTASLLTLVGWWRPNPELCLALSLGLGAAATCPIREGRAALVLATTGLAGWIALSLQIPAALVAGGCAGLIATWLGPDDADLLDVIHVGLATACLAGLGLWAASWLGGDDVRHLTGGWIGLVTGVLAPQGSRVLAWPSEPWVVPSGATLRHTVRPEYRTPVTRAKRIYRASIRHTESPTIRAGLREMVRWIYRLQMSLQELDLELHAQDPGDLRRRIAALQIDPTDDPLTSARRHATKTHLRRALAHHELGTTERSRLQALSEHTLAHMEEIRSALALAGRAPDLSHEHVEALTTQLGERLVAFHARRATERELDAVGR